MTDMTDPRPPGFYGNRIYPYLAERYGEVWAAFGTLALFLLFGGVLFGGAVLIAYTVLSALPADALGYFGSPLLPLSRGDALFFGWLAYLAVRSLIREAKR